ncbi:beta-fructofuranosidase, insoluble isoenzyme 4-like [Iris pallida]|uniref:Beta-fructofuranosidase, insoluble isoenzyme 4-like n=1 Tax=Iris pallida TaxID=29817 RepID=A0AAX6DFE2_IRIPA|nr:beta-fructofuranosidase, insoluble isoenzyme 4-like [Iris pallida]
MASSCLSGLGWIFGLFFSFSFVFFKNPDSPGKSSANVSPEYRTAYHFQPAKYWINDPNGPMYYNGIYHLFYQYNPYAAVWGNISWGHSVSTDLVHWTGVGLALSPTDPYDIDGCFSGSITILPDNTPVIIYTGITSKGEQVQNIAYPKNVSDPYLREWIKSDSNPVIEAADGVNASEFRDPTTAWRGQDGLWRILIGNKVGLGGQAILYRSSDFVHWVQAKEPLHSSADRTGVWECPDFYSYDGKYVLKVSLQVNWVDHYMLGGYDEEKDLFEPSEEFAGYRNWRRYDHGKSYASKTFVDKLNGRRISWAWLNESDTVSDAVEKGWAGIQTTPRVVTLDSNGRQLVQWPVKELESLRKKRVQLHDAELKTGGLLEIKGIRASQAKHGLRIHAIASFFIFSITYADVEVEFEVSDLEGAEHFDPTWLVDPQKLCTEKGASVQGGVGPFGLLVLASEDREEHTAVYFRVFKDHNNTYKVLMCSDQTRSSLRTELDKPAYGGFVDIDIKKDGKISLRTLIDHTVVESFGGGGRTCITARVYPTFLAKSDAHLYAFNNGSTSAKISELKAWTMAKAHIG